MAVVFFLLRRIYTAIFIGLQRICCLLVAVILMCSCSLLEQGKLPSFKAQDGLIKSENDQRVYRRLQLQNKLDVLLISDPDSDKAAVALDLYMGSYQNPANVEGLAHFLEHMLFLGTKRYPSAGEYQTFISEHGGSHNASTSLEHTNYFFNIDAAYLEDALHRFAPFFYEPTFDAKYVNRERNAVESEYQLKLKSDSRRQWDVLREIINPQHPLSKFTVGNNQTLVDRENNLLRDQLIEMYNSYYSANLMTLVVLGNQSIEHLQAMVEREFSPISNKNTVIKPNIAPLIEPSRLPLKAHIKPLKELRELSLLFELPQLDRYWQIKPAMYMGEMIGYEGQGSLLQALKTKGWAEYLSAGPALSDRGATIFAIDIGLTPEGFNNQEQVLAELFSWIELIKQQGIDHWRQDELAIISGIAFRYSEKVKPTAYVTDLASNMHKYKGNNLLLAPYQRDYFDSQLIVDLLDRISIENMLLMVIAPEIETTDTSKFYKTAYSSETMSSQDISSIKLAETLFDLNLVGKNPYIPSDLDLIKEPDDPTPELHTDLDGLKVWYQKSTAFGVPRGQIVISLQSKAVSGVAGYTIAELYSAYIQDQLRQRLYPALIAGLSYDIQPTKEGISIVIKGYSDKQVELLKTVLTTFSEAKIDSDQLALVKQQLLREKLNAKREYPFRQIISYLYADIAGRYMPEWQIPVLEAVEVAGVELFIKQLLAEVKIEVLVTGNHTMSSVDQIAAQFSDFNLHNLISDKAVVKLSEDDRYRKVFIDHNDKVLLRYIQADNDSLHERALVSLLANIMSSPFYNQLRTEKQLGYVVAAFPRHINRVPGICFIAQSPVASEGELLSEFKGFSQKFTTQIKDLTDDTLAVHKKALLVNLEDDPENLNELTGRSTKAISLGYFEFNFRSRLSEAINAVTVDDIQSAYSRLFLESPRQLWIQTTENKASEKGANFDDQVNQYYKFSY